MKLTPFLARVRYNLGRSAAIVAILVGALAIPSTTAGAIHDQPTVPSAANFADITTLNIAQWPRLAISATLTSGAVYDKASDTMTVAQSPDKDEMNYWSLTELARVVFAENGATGDRCDAEAWAAVHGATPASLKLRIAGTCKS